MVFDVTYSCLLVDSYYAALAPVLPRARLINAVGDLAFRWVLVMLVLDE